MSTERESSQLRLLLARTTRAGGRGRAVSAKNNATGTLEETRVIMKNRVAVGSTTEIDHETVWEGTKSEENYKIKRVFPRLSNVRAIVRASCHRNSGPNLQTGWNRQAFTIG